MALLRRLNYSWTGLLCFLCSADAKALDLEPGAPLLQIDRIAMSLDGKSVVWRVSRCDKRDIVYAVDVN